MYSRIFLYLIFSAWFLQGCDSIEYSPNQSFDAESPKDINKKNLQRLAETPGDDTLRFVLTGDSQREYRYSEKLVDTINKIPGVDFVLLDGDISDFGLLQEMEWVHAIFAKLKVPYLGVIGNHDLVANGEAAFKKMYGELNYSFIYQGVKFVCHNTNSRESSFSGNVPDLNWLKNEMAPEAGVDAYISVAHVPPYPGDFDPALVEDYINVVNGSPNTLAALFAHTHTAGVSYFHDQNIPYIVTNAIENREFVLVEIVKGKLTYKNVEY